MVGKTKRPSVSEYAQEDVAENEKHALRILHNIFSKLSATLDLGKRVINSKCSEDSNGGRGLGMGNGNNNKTELCRSFVMGHGLYPACGKTGFHNCNRQ